MLDYWKMLPMEVYDCDLCLFGADCDDCYDEWFERAFKKYATAERQKNSGAVDENDNIRGFSNFATAVEKISAIIDEMDPQGQMI